MDATCFCCSASLRSRNAFSASEVSTGLPRIADPDRPSGGTRARVVAGGDALPRGAKGTAPRGGVATLAEEAEEEAGATGPVEVVAGAARFVGDACRCRERVAVGGDSPTECTERGWVLGEGAPRPTGAGPVGAVLEGGGPAAADAGGATAGVTAGITAGTVAAADRRMGEGRLSALVTEAGTAEAGVVRRGGEACRSKEPELTGADGADGAGVGTAGVGMAVAGVAGAGAGAGTACVGTGAGAGEGAGDGEEVAAASGAAAVATGAGVCRGILTAEAGAWRGIVTAGTGADADTGASAGAGTGAAGVAAGADMVAGR